MSVVVVDYGIGNLGAIPNMLQRAGAPTEVTSDHRKIAAAERLILPGVGAYDAGVRNLRESGLWDVLNEKALVERIPILGLCLGMELMSDRSEEGTLTGLGWIPGEVVRFNPPRDSRLRVPHMGWNTVTATRASPVSDVIDGARFYFAHSFHFRPANEASIAGVTTFDEPFVSVVHRDNIVGVQFHPEKSHRFGLALLSRFATD